MCLAWRLAQLTPFQPVTLFALHLGKHAGFHGIVEITTNSRFHVSEIHAQPRRLFLPADSSSGKEEAPGILDERGSLKFKCQSREGTSTYCRTRMARGGAGGGGVRRPAERSGGVVNAECFSCLSRCRKRSPDRAHVCSRILFGGRGSQKPPRLYLLSCMSMLFYSCWTGKYV